MAVIKEDEVSQALNKAPLKQSDDGEVEFVKSIPLYNVSKKQIDIIKSKGYTFNSYAKRAIEEQLRKDGLL